MNSFNGDLYFAAGIDDSKFNVTTEAMERRVEEMSATVQSEAADMETSIQQFAQKGAEYITTFLVGKGMVDLTKSIIEVRGQFQQLEIAFETMLGSTEKANDLMAQLTQTAAKTPFDLQGVAQGAKQLLAYGTAAEEVNDVLVHLGDIASGLSIPLNDLVMLYGTTMTQGRMFTQDLRQFMGRGIPIAEELAKQFGVTKDKVGELVTQGKVTSKEFNAAIMAMSSEGGKFYNLMEKQSASLTGQISNLEDAWDVARNNIGKNMEGIAGDAISMATSIVENLEPILNVVRSVAIAYGSYRAALILNSLATKGETGVALIDNTVKKAKIQLLRLEEKATSGAAERIRELKKARQEEIATLENQLSAEERLNLIHNTRIANIGKVLTETQKLELCNLGLIDSTGNLTGSTEDYERIALSMMSNEQRMAVERGELTKNTGDYIAKLHEAVDAKHINIKAIDDEIAKTQDELKFAVEYRNVVQEQVATSRDRCKSLENEISMLDLAGDSEGAAAKATEWKAEKTKLATLEEELNTAATSVNEKQTNLETLAKKRNAAATVQGTTADKAGAAAKTLFATATKKATLAIKALWAAMRANPLGWILTLFGAVVSVIQLFKSKTDDAGSAVEDYNSAIRDEKNELRTLIEVLAHAEEGSIIYKDTVEKLKQLAEKHKVSIYDENGALREQKQIYEELSAAIRETTAEKIRAKYIEKYNKELEDNLQEQLDDLIKKGNEANYSHKTGSRVQMDYGTEEVQVIKNAEHIRKMQESEWVTIFEEMVDTAERMNEVSAEKAEEMFNKSFENILSYIKRVSGASDEELNIIKYYIKDTFNDVVNTTNETGKKVAGLGEIGFSEGIKAEADIAKMSIKELEDKIADVNSQLEILAANANNYQLPGLWTGLMGQDDNMPTWGPFVDRNAQLKYEKEQEKRRYQEELEKRRKAQQQRQLTDAEKRELEKREKARQDAEKKLKDMQVASQQAAIDAMEDGFKKRMAQMELERQQELDKINKDAEDLKEARKKAGLSGTLTQEEQDNLQSRRDNVNKKYGNNRAALAEDEIKTMREKYAEYNKWVQMVDQETADAHFRGLREGGENFSTWIRNQITRLEELKRENPDLFTDGDQRALDMFNGALTGADNPDNYDIVRREMEASIATATTLTEKIKLLNAAIEKIKKDDRLTKDQRATLGLQFAEDLVNAEAENQRRFNETYQMYSKTRRETVAQYQADIDRLIANGNTFQAEQVKAEMKRAMGNLDENFLKGLFGEVFSGKATTKAIRAAVKDLNKMKGMDLVTFNSTYNTDFTQEELDALREKIDAVNSSLKNMSGYNIADAFKDIRDGRLEGDLERVARGTQYIQNAFQNFTSVVSALSSALNDLAEASDNDNLKNTAKTVSQVSNVLNTAGQWAGMGASIGGGWGAAIGAILGGGLGIFTEIFKSKQEKEEARQAEIQSRIDFLPEIYKGIIDIVESVSSLNGTVHSLDYKNFKTALLDVLNSFETNPFNQPSQAAWDWRDAMNRNGFGATGNSNTFGALYTVTNPAGVPPWLQAMWYGAYTQLGQMMFDRLGGTGNLLSGGTIPHVDRDIFNEIWANAVHNIEQSYTHSDYSRDNSDYSIGNGIAWAIVQYIQGQYDRLGGLQGQYEEYYSNHPYDSLGLFNISQQAYEINKNILEAEYMAAVLSGDEEEAAELLKQITSLELQQVSALQEMAEGLYGTDILSIIEEWISIFDEFGDNVEGAFDKIDEGIDNMIANMLKKRLIVEPMLEYFDSLFRDYEDEDGNIDESDFINIARAIGEGKEEFKNRYLAYLEALREAGIEFDSSIADPSTLTGSIQNVSEETGGIIAGRLNAVVINQAEGVSVMRQQLLVQYEMRNSLAAIQSDVNTIKQSIGNTATPNPYLYRGIL